MIEEPVNSMGATVEPDEHASGYRATNKSSSTELVESALGCQYCGSYRLRRSRVRFRDVFEILRLRYPMRCTRCNQRQHQNVNLAFLSSPSKMKRARGAEDENTWQTWTQSSPDTPLSTRPMTTAMGTQAQRLPKVAVPESASQTSESASRSNENW